MFVWTKRSSEKNAEAWEERFPAGAGMTLVTTRVPGSPSIQLELYCQTEPQAQRAKAQYGGAIRKLKDQNWAALSCGNLPPIKVRDRLLICPAHTDAEVAAAQKQFPGRAVIAVPADMAFGTGHHATTATVLRMLVDAAAAFDREGTSWTMADLGCGSGILAIAAAKLGAAKAWGCDFDAKAVRVARANATLNRVPKVRFTEVDILEWEPQAQWDVVAANMFADLLEQAFPQIVRTVKPGGLLMVSGILKTQAAQCLEAGRRCGAAWERIVTKGKWTSACGRIQ